MHISLEQAVSDLNQGKVVAVPTETVYGLAAALRHPEAIEKIFALKGRPRSNPLIIHVADRSTLNEYVLQCPPRFEELAEAFWPGSLTLILSINAMVPTAVTAGLSTAAFRVPALELTRSLIQATGPLVMPSANLSGRPSATSPEHVEEDFGMDFPVLNGGPCPKGVESTILYYQEPEWIIVRLGAIAPQAFETVLGYQPCYSAKTTDKAPLCPGQLYRHYAPRARLLLEEADPAAPYIIGFKERHYSHSARVVLLGSLDNPEQVAENLYGCLRLLDQEGAEWAWVDMDFPRSGLWQTIAERLIRAGEYEDHKQDITL